MEAAADAVGALLVAAGGGHLGARRVCVGEWVSASAQITGGSGLQAAVGMVWVCPCLRCAPHMLGHLTCCSEGGGGGVVDADGGVDC
jgi:hypothetical protein